MSAALLVYHAVVALDSWLRLEVSFNQWVERRNIEASIDDYQAGRATKTQLLLAIADLGVSGGSREARKVAERLRVARLWVVEHLFDSWLDTSSSTTRARFEQLSVDDLRWIQGVIDSLASCYVRTLDRLPWYSRLFSSTADLARETMAEWRTRQDAAAEQEVAEQQQGILTYQAVSEAVANRAEIDSSTAERIARARARTLG